MKNYRRLMPTTTNVRDVMTKSVITLRAEQSFEETADILAHAGAKQHAHQCAGGRMNGGKGGCCIKRAASRKTYDVIQEP